MKKLSSLLIVVFLFSSVFSQSIKTIAVLYFENNSLSQKQELDPLRKGLADMFITEFSKIDHFQVVERSQLQQLLEEMKLGQSGLLKEETAQQVGKLLGAETLLLGSFMHMFDGKMRVDLRIVEVETGMTIKAAEETGKPKDLYKMVSKLTMKILQDLDIKLSKTEAQRLASVENTSFEAAMFYAKGLECEDEGKKDEAIKMYKNALQKNANFIKAKQRIAELTQ